MKGEERERTKNSAKHPKRYANKRGGKWSWHAAAKHLGISVKVLKRDYEEYYERLKEYIDGN